MGRAWRELIVGATTALLATGVAGCGTLFGVDFEVSPSASDAGAATYVVGRGSATEPQAAEPDGSSPACGGCTTSTPHDTWATVASVPTARRDLAAVVAHDGRIFAIGGADADGVAMATVEAYTPSTNTWETLASMPTARSTLAAVVAADGRIFAIGGFDETNLARVEAYTPTTDTWERMASLPLARSALGAALRPNGQLLAIGGDNGGTDGSKPETARSNVDAYAVATDAWTTAAALPTPRGWLATTVAPDGRIFAIGGYDGTSELSTVEAFTHSTGKWSGKASLPTARCELAAATSDGRIFAIGGNVGGSGGSYFSTVEAYSAETNTWATAAKMPTARTALAAATAADGRIFAIGGDDGTKILATVEAYTP
jgi:N-acetylneuraminic acid mutarotase